MKIAETTTLGFERSSVDLNFTPVRPVQSSEPLPVHAVRFAKPVHAVPVQRFMAVPVRVAAILTVMDQGVRIFGSKEQLVATAADPAACAEALATWYS